jgi:hypothetical protein
MEPGDIWKRWLLNDLHGIREEMTGGNWDESPSFRSAVVERFVFISSYVVRKLRENEQLTLDLLERDWRVRQFVCTREPPSRQQFRRTSDFRTFWQPIDEYYDLARPHEQPLRLKRLCDLVIHHFAFDVRTPNPSHVEFYFNSDHSREKCIYMMTLDAWIEMTDEVAHDRAIFFTVDRATGRPLRHRTRRLDLL